METGSGTNGSGGLNLITSHHICTQNGRGGAVDNCSVMYLLPLHTAQCLLELVNAIGMVEVALLDGWI